jgi:hypothetical protein
VKDSNAAQSSWQPARTGHPSRRITPPAEHVEESGRHACEDRGNANTTSAENQADNTSGDPAPTEVEGTGTERAEEELQKERYALALLMLAAWAGCFSSHESSVANALAVTTGGQNADTVAAARVIIRLLEVILEKGPVGTELAVLAVRTDGGGPTDVARWVDMKLCYGRSSVRRSSSSYWVVSRSRGSSVICGRGCSSSSVPSLCPSRWRIIIVIVPTLVAPGSCRTVLELPSLCCHSSGQQRKQVTNLHRAIL